MVNRPQQVGAMGKKKAKSSATTGEPKFPYTTAPNALRKFLKLVPMKPKPPRVSTDVLKGWGLTSSNDRSIIPVLKAINFLGPSGETTPQYEAFMHPATGPATLGAEIQRVYERLFQTSHQPHKDSDGDLRRMFNIHSGGSESTIGFQIQTLKALSEFASFDGVSGAGAPAPAGHGTLATGSTASQQASLSGGVATIHIDLHIHLPENKTARDYEAIIQDIARYIYKQEVAPNGQ